MYICVGVCMDAQIYFVVYIRSSEKYPLVIKKKEKKRECTNKKWKSKRIGVRIG